MKIFRNIVIVLLVGLLLTVGIIYFEKSSKIPTDFSAVIFVENGYSDRTEEDKENEEVYAELMKKVFENSDKGAKDDAHEAKKPLLKFITHNGGKDLKNYKIFMISLPDKDFRIVSEDGKLYTVKEEGLSYLFQIEEVHKAVFNSNPPKTILMTTVDSGPRLLGTLTDGQWKYLSETGSFVETDLKLSEVEESTEVLDLGLYNFKLIFTETPDRVDITLLNTATKEERLIEDYKIGEPITGLTSGKSYLLRVNAEWLKAPDENFYGHVVYEFQFNTK